MGQNAGIIYVDPDIDLASGPSQLIDSQVDASDANKKEWKPLQGNYADVEMHSANVIIDKNGRKHFQSDRGQFIENPGKKLIKDIKSGNIPKRKLVSGSASVSLYNESYSATEDLVIGTGYALASFSHDTGKNGSNLSANAEIGVNLYNASVQSSLGTGQVDANILQARLGGNISKDGVGLRAELNLAEATAQFETQEICGPENCYSAVGNVDAGIGIGGGIEAGKQKKGNKTTYKFKTGAGLGPKLFFGGALNVRKRDN